MTRLIQAVVLAVVAMLLTASAALAGPTCTDVLDIDNHGHHVVADYVTGIGHDNLEWPPSGANASGGAALPGGPAAGGHFGAGIAPGASFCTDSSSPGVHL